MSRSRTFLKLERTIARAERGGILDRWRSGRQLVEAKSGRKQLPHGMSADLIASATRAGLKLSEREIQYRIQCATAYDSEAKVRSAAADFESWRALCDAGFPAVESTDPADLEAAGISIDPPDAWEQLPLIPGFGEEITVRGRKVPLTEATVADAKAYRENFKQMHENFGKTLAQIDESVATMVDGSDGDDDANAVEAWKRGAGIDDDTDESDGGDDA